MTLRIGLAYNEKPEDAEPPSSGSDGNSLEPPSSRAHDRYAEWDEPATIAAVESALRRLGKVVRLEADLDFPLKLRDAQPNVVFNIAEGLHGPNREAHVPAICEFYGIPYTGSDPLTLSLALDKQRAKEVFRARGVPTPDWVVLGNRDLGAAKQDAGTRGWGDAGRSPRPRVTVSPRPASPRPRVTVSPRPDFPLPAIVKPLYEGSSMGIPAAAVCETAEAVTARAAEVVARYREPALVEEFLPGREFTCAILGNGRGARALPLVEVRFDALPAGAPPIYGYEAKWVWDTPDDPLEIFECPAEVESELGRAIEATALGAYHALGCREWARVDLRLDAAGRPHVLEVNPLPGILPDPDQNSCFPKAARAAGIGYDDLICAVLELALERYGMRP